MEYYKKSINLVVEKKTVHSSPLYEQTKTEIGF